LEVRSVFWQLGACRPYSDIRQPDPAVLIAAIATPAIRLAIVLIQRLAAIRTAQISVVLILTRWFSAASDSLWSRQ
jgi:hypothetical protein